MAVGAFGQGPFDNDAAGDYVAGLEKDSVDNIAGNLTATMRAVAASAEYLEAPQAEEAIAAAVLVAAQHGDIAVTSRSARNLLESHRFTVDDTMRTLAARTLERISSPSDNEWYELWQDTELEEVLERLRPYGTALTVRQDPSTA